MINKSYDRADSEYKSLSFKRISTKSDMNKSKLESQIQDKKINYSYCIQAFKI